VNSCICNNKSSSIGESGSSPGHEGWRIDGRGGGGVSVGIADANREGHCLVNVKHLVGNGGNCEHGCRVCADNEVEGRRVGCTVAVRARQSNRSRASSCWRSRERASR